MSSSLCNVGSPRMYKLIPVMTRHAYNNLTADSAEMTVCSAAGSSTLLATSQISLDLCASQAHHGSTATSQQAQTYLHDTRSSNTAGVNAAAGWAAAHYHAEPAQLLLH
jgi:hypothetical protein